MATYRGSGIPTGGSDVYSQAELDAAVSAAAASASAAATSEANAAASESNAAASETAAALSESNAATSEANAAASEAAASTSETNAAASEAAAAASYDSFDDRYLGAKASDPTLDNDGNALLIGALYFNTTNNVMRVYGGSSWADVGSATANITEWTVTATTTTFSGLDDNSVLLAYTPGYLMVFQNGTLLDPNDYTATNGTSVVLGVAAESGDTVNIVGFGTFDVSTSYTKTESDGRYYTQTQLDAGQLDTRYYTEAESDAAFATLAQAIRENIIINGDFRIAQRGTTFTSVASSAYTLDRWSYARSNDGAVDVTQQVATANPLWAYYLQVNVTTADTSIAAGQYDLINNLIEGHDSGNLGYGGSSAVDVTLSFWHAHTKTGTYCVAFRNSANDRAYIAEYTQSAADTWEKAEITVPGCTDGTWVKDNGVGLRVSFLHACGTTYQTTAGSWQTGNYIASSNQVNGLDTVSNKFRYANVKLEAGSYATDWFQRSAAEELALCQRYYEKSYNLTVAPGTVTTAGEVRAIMPKSTAYMLPLLSSFRVSKRTTPTVTWYDPVNGTADRVYNGSLGTSLVVDLNALYGESSAGYPRTSSTAPADTEEVLAHWTADAEL